MKNYKQWWSIFVVILLISISIIFFMFKKEEIISLLNISLYLIFILIFLNLITLILNGLRIKVLMEPYNIKLKFSEWSGISVLNTAGNYLTPFQGGLFFRSIYLKKKYNFPYSSFITTVLASYIAGFFIYGLIGIILVLFFNSNFLFKLPMVIFFFILTLFTLYIILFSPKINNTSFRFINRFIKIINEWSNISKKKTFVVKLLAIEFFSLIFVSLRMFYAFKAISYSLGFASSIFISIFFSISVLLSITPAGLGIRESFVGFSSQIIGLNFDKGVIAATIDRIIIIVLIIILAPIFTYFLSKKSKKL